MEENSTLLRRMLHKTARAARSVALVRPSPPPPTPAATPCRLPPSLLDCTDGDGDDDESPSFHTAASTPASSTPPLRSRLLGSSTPGAADAADVDRRAAEFIERFRRNASLELRYCSQSSSSPVTPAMPPTSPDTYFNLSRLHGAVREHHDAPVRARPAPPYGRRSSPPGAGARERASGMSIKWPSGTYLRRRPTVQV